MFRRFAIAIALCVATSGVAAAQDKPKQPAARAKPAKPAKSAKPTAPTRPRDKTLVFDVGSDIDGGIRSPDGDQTLVIKPATHTSLIKVRRNFIPEILKTADDL